MPRARPLSADIGCIVAGIAEAARPQFGIEHVTGELYELDDSADLEKLKAAFPSTTSTEIPILWHGEHAPTQGAH